MRLIRSVVIGAITLFCVMTVFSVALFTKCRCLGKHFSPYLSLVSGWTPGVRGDLPSCRENLITLEAAKYDWASENGADAGTEVTWDDVRIYLDNGKPPLCNRGGHYIFGRVGEEPDCVGACALHADPLAHALEPAILYACTEDNALSSARAVFEGYREARDEAKALLPPRQPTAAPKPEAAGD